MGCSRLGRTRQRQCRLWFCAQTAWCSSSCLRAGSVKQGTGMCSSSCVWRSTRSAWSRSHASCSLRWQPGATSSTSVVPFGGSGAEDGCCNTVDGFSNVGPRWLLLFSGGRTSLRRRWKRSSGAQRAGHGQLPWSRPSSHQQCRSRTRYLFSEVRADAKVLPAPGWNQSHATSAVHIDVLGTLLHACYRNALEVLGALHGYGRAEMALGEPR